MLEATRKLRSNRTFMELKSVNGFDYLQSYASSNRTFMELKSEFLLDQHYSIMF